MLLAHRQVREQVEALEDHAHVLAQFAHGLRVLVQQRLAVDGQLAALELFQAVDAAQQRALARAALADDGDHLAARDLQVDALEHLVACHRICAGPGCRRWTFQRCDIHLPLEGFGIQTDRVTQQKVHQRDAAEDQKRAERGVGNGLADLGQLHETDHRRQCRALDDLHQEADGRRDRDPHRLRQDDVAQLFDEVQRQALRGLPLAARNRGDAAAPDLGQEGAGIQRQSHAGSHPGRGVDAEQAQPVVGQEQLDQQRNALKDLDIGGNQGLHAGQLAQAQHQQQQARPGRRRQRRSATAQTVQRSASSRLRTMSQSEKSTMASAPSEQQPAVRPSSAHGAPRWPAAR